MMRPRSSPAQRAATAWRRALASLIAVTAALTSPAAAAPPWEVWGDLSRLAHVIEGDQVLLRGSHCPSGCRFDRTSEGDHRFLRWEGEEAVIFDEPGAGAITRIWMTMGDGRSRPLDPSVRMRIFIDGETSPRVDLPIPDLFAGAHPPFLAPLVLERLATSGGYVSYVPIPYRRGCRVTLVGAAAARIWYQIGFHRLASDDEVLSFRGDEDLSPLVDLLSAPGADPWPRPHPRHATVDTVLSPAQPLTLLDLEGAGELRHLRLRLPRASWRRVWLTVDVDGSRRVDMRVNDFFAVGRASDAPTRSLLVGTDADGALYSYFPMPFRRGMRVELHDRRPDGAAPVDVDASLGWSDQPPAASAAPFFATLRSEVTTDPELDLPLLSLRGSGKWVGLFLDLGGVGTARRDYLEGDERVYLDGSSSPAIYGTGVEDFFNGGFYFDLGTRLQALHGSSYQLIDASGERFDGMYRLMLTDAVPFQSSLEAALENGPGPPTGHLHMRSRAIAYGYLRSERPWVLVDRVDLANRGSRRTHRYQAPAGASCSVLDATYEDDLPRQRTARGCYFAVGASSFTLLPGRPGPLRLRRLLDAGAGAPEADVLLGGRVIATFPYVAANPYHRWQELDVDLLSADGAPLRLMVRPRHEPGGADVHSEFVYELWRLAR